MTNAALGRRRVPDRHGGIRCRVLGPPPHLPRRRAGARRQPARIKFAVIGINHAHINSQVDAVHARRRRAGVGLREGAGPARRPSSSGFHRRSSRASENEILEDPSIQLVLSSGDPRRARAARHPRDAARQGLHVRQAGHHHARAARRGAAGAGGDQAHLLDHVQRAVREPRDGQGRRAGQGRRDRPGRPDDRTRAASHDAGDAAGVVLRQGRGTAASSATSARTRPISSSTSPARRSGDVVASQVGNVHHPKHPKFEDFGDMVLRGDRGTGYIRVDWFTPDGLSTWGDGRLTILGTDGFIELRKNVDIAGRPGGSHLFLVDQQGDPLHRLQRRCRCRTASSSCPTSSTAPRPRCRRRTASSPPS